MISPIVGVPGIALAGLLLLSAIGSGPAVRLAGTPLVAPALGLALVTGVLTTVAYLTPLGVVGPLLLIASALGSLVWAVSATGQRRLPSSRGLIAAAGASLSGLVLASAPALGHRTYGPVNLHFNDSWFYASVDWFLRDNRLGGPIVSPEIYPPNSVVEYVQAFDVRVGIDVWQASLSALLGLDPGAVQSGAQASTVAIISLTAYALARCVLRASRVWSLVAALASLSPITVQLLADPRPANLAAIAIAPVGLTFGARALSPWGCRNDALVAGIAASGLLVTYTEHSPTVVLTAALGWLVALVVSSQRRSLVWTTIRRIPLVVVTALAVSPLGVLRALEYARVLGSGDNTGSPSKAGVSLEALPVLLAGTFHLHELDQIEDLGPLATAGLYNVTFLALGIGLIGSLWIARRSPRSVLLLPAVAVVIVSAGLYLYFAVRGGCGDCVYKSVTLSPVFTAVIIVAAAQGVWRSGRGNLVFRAAVATCLAAYLGLVVRGQAELIRGSDRAQAVARNQVYDIPTAIAGLPSAPVLIEGASSTSDFEPFFHGPEMLYLLGRDRSHPLRYEKTLSALISGFNLPSEPYDTDYRYVVSGYPGLRTDRRTIKDFGEYVLQEREEVDVLVLQSAGARDPRYRRSAAIPWIRGPFAIRAAGVERGGTLVLRFTGGVVPATRFAVAGYRTQQIPSGRPGEVLLCADVPRGTRMADMTIVPGDFSVTTAPRQEVDGPVLSPKGVGLAGWTWRDSRHKCAPDL